MLWLEFKIWLRVKKIEFRFVIVGDWDILLLFVLFFVFFNVVLKIYKYF